ncbi:hypothetical protein ACNKHN_14465 [Shigella flexneri]
MDLKRHDTIGLDLVAMCVNDWWCKVPNRCFYLRLYATGKLDVDTASAVIRRHRGRLSAIGLFGRWRNGRNAGDVSR